MAIGHSGDEEPQSQPFSTTGNESKSRVALEHRVLRRCHPVHLEVVIHEGQGAYAYRLGALGQVGHARPDAGRTACPVESRDVEIEFHRRRSSTCTSIEGLLGTCVISPTRTAIMRWPGWTSLSGSHSRHAGADQDDDRWGPR